jgi:CRP/FNR family transcriptional regulator, anaerobic regulatory protein
MDLLPTTTGPSLAQACPAWRGENPCLPCTLGAAETEGLQLTRRRLRRGQSLYRQGEACGHLYAVRSGTFKSVLVTPDAREQVTGFQLAGEVLALDALGEDRHATGAVALEDSEVIAIRYADAKGAGARELQQVLPRLLGRELVRKQKLAVLLSSMGAQQRLASFLLNLGARMEARGYSGREFRLRMTRCEIGSYLGLTLETVSRQLSAFARRGWIEVDGHDVRLLDRPALLRLFDAT